MNKLFAVLLSGRAEGCNTELHDTVFIVGQSLEKTYPRLVHKWFGIHKRLHIDSSVELSHVDSCSSPFIHLKFLLSTNETHFDEMLSL